MRVSARDEPLVRRRDPVMIAAFAATETPVPDQRPTAVIRAEPDGYDLARERLMGRQSAGNGFLRAAVQARGSHPVLGLTPSHASARRIAELVKALDPAAPFEWVHPEALRRVAEIGTLYTPGPSLGLEARLRQRLGLAAFSICGVTHTTASLRAMEDIADLLHQPVAPWDALVCTSTAVVETVRQIHAAETDYLKWRFGTQARIVLPELPVIPLGVHADDFTVDAAARRDARGQLGLADDTVVGLFVGRLVFHAKAHPYPMLRAFELAARRTGRTLALVFCGWFPNAAIETAFRDGCRAFAPSVRAIFLEGRDATLRRQAWASADLFLSLADNVQETFGLTPLEAMAAGLPVIVSDWDGYRDTVRHEVDGFRIPTTAPAGGLGESLIYAHESDLLTYDQYCWAAAAATSVDVRVTTEAVVALVQDPALRRRMGEQGRRHVRERFDWHRVYAAYQALWAELGRRRRAATATASMSKWAQAMPRTPAARLDPFQAFAHYPTATIGPATILAPCDDAGGQALAGALDHALFGSLAVPRPVIEGLLAELRAGPRTLEACAKALRAAPPVVARAAGLLLKLGLVQRVP